MVILIIMVICLFLFGGVVIIGGMIIGVGMFLLLVVMFGVWFFWLLVVLVFIWFCMLYFGLMIFEVNFNYCIGFSFDIIIKDLFGKGWNLVNGVLIVFVFYILIYVYILVSGLIFYYIFSELLLKVLVCVVGFGFVLLVVFIVWMSIKVVSCMMVIVLGVKVIIFFLIFGSLFGYVELMMLFNVVEKNVFYVLYLLMMFLFCLVLFGYYGNVLSLMKYYGKDLCIIICCLIYGMLLVLGLYVVWLLVMMGNIFCLQFIDIVQKGGNIDVLVQVLSGVLNSWSLDLLLVVFLNFVVVSLFFGVMLGLFDYLVDLFGFDDSVMGCFKIVLLIFILLMIGGLVKFDGFFYVIGYVGLVVMIWVVIVLVLLVYVLCKCFGSLQFCVWGGMLMIVLILFFGFGNVVVYILLSVNLLLVYQ